MFLAKLGQKIAKYTQIGACHFSVGVLRPLEIWKTYSFEFGPLRARIRMATSQQILKQKTRAEMILFYVHDLYLQITEMDKDFQLRYSPVSSQVDILKTFNDHLSFEKNIFLLFFCLSSSSWSIAILQINFYFQTTSTA